MPAETLRSALSYEPEEGEVLIASYPKCGTTWLQHIVLNIFFSGESTPEELEEVRKSSYLEFIGAEGARKLRRPAAIKTHLPFSKLPYSEKVKYIYVARNPYDCCVSYYHHFRTRPWHHFAEGTFEEHLDMFVEGKVDYGDYFDHLLPWYELRHASNVLFLTYEELKKDTTAWVLRIADFLCKQEYGDRLSAHPRYLEMVLNAISFKSMKKLTFSLESPTYQSRRKEDDGIEESSQCGTTWLHHIVLNIIFSGKLTPRELEELKKGSFLERTGAECARKIRRPAAIKTHLPYFKLPYPAKATYIYVTRNPYDCCVSYYHHLKAMPWHRFAEGTVYELFDMFIEGKVDYGDYFDHVIAWYPRRDATNVLFLTCEELKKNTTAWVFRIADFVDKQEYGDRLRAHAGYAEMVLNGISFESMKKLSLSLEATAE
ncbi:hypothetical protein V5799_033942 [Amblyomma americanum]|uniref:Sulfotransferase domain-containing protein n=1 Tax=Amblyomma americanum TaxID=6943 RepID=A0AAQ4DLW6_AMBAM